MNDDSVTIALPWPPSTNSYYRHVELPLGKFRCPKCGRRKTRVTTLLSAEGREWLVAVNAVLERDKLAVLDGPVEMFLTLHAPNRRAIDIDNRQKPVLDALKRRKRRVKGVIVPDERQTAWLFADDSQVRRLTTEFGPIIGGGACVVTLRKMPVAETQAWLGFEPETK